MTHKLGVLLGDVQGVPRRKQLVAVVFRKLWSLWVRHHGVYQGLWLRQYNVSLCSHTTNGTWTQAPTARFGASSLVGRQWTRRRWSDVSGPVVSGRRQWTRRRLSNLKGRPGLVRPRGKSANRLLFRAVAEFSNFGHTIKWHDHQTTCSAVFDMTTDSWGFPKQNIL